MKSKIITALEVKFNKINILQAEIEQGGINIITLHEEPLEDIDDIEEQNKQIVTALHKLKEKFNINKTKLFTVMPRHQVFLRKIIIPPVVESEIEGLLEFEAEKYLPFSIDTAVIDYFSYTPLSSKTQNEIFLIAAKSEIIKKYLDLFDQARLFPEKISISSISIANIVKNIKEGIENNSGFITVDGNICEIGFFVNHNICISRGMILSKLNEKQSPQEQAIAEFENSLSNFNSSYRDVNLEKIYFFIDSGNEEFPDNFKNSGNIPQFVFDLEEAARNTLKFPAGSEKLFLNRFSVCAGLLLPSIHDANLIPKNIKDLHKSKIKIKKNIIFILWSMAAVSFVIGAFFFFQYRKTATKRELMRKIENMKPELMELSKLDQKLQKINNFKTGNMAVLKILKDLSLTIPQNVYLRRFYYDYEKKNLIIQGRTSSYASASRVAFLMGKSKHFSQVENKGAHMIKIENQELVDFEISCTLKG